MREKLSVFVLNSYLQAPAPVCAARPPHYYCSQRTRGTVFPNQENHA
jgi:hypothetical protein